MLIECERFRLLSTWEAEEGPLDAPPTPRLACRIAVSESASAPFAFPDGLSPADARRELAEELEGVVHASTMPASISNCLRRSVSSLHSRVHANGERLRISLAVTLSSLSIFLHAMRQPVAAWCRAHGRWGIRVKRRGG